MDEISLALLWPITFRLTWSSFAFFPQTAPHCISLSGHSQRFAILSVSRVLGLKTHASTFCWMFFFPFLFLGVTFIFCVWLFLPARMYVHHKHAWHPHEKRKPSWNCNYRLMSGSGARDQTWVLCTDSKCSKPPNQCPSPVFPIFDMLFFFNLHGIIEIFLNFLSPFKHVWLLYILSFIFLMTISRLVPSKV